jgi:hypothetical protein
MVMIMQNRPVNRLEHHWSKAVLPEAEQYRDEPPVGTLQGWERSVEDFMSDHPKLSIAAAAAFGMVLGWMVKRK